MEYFEKLVRLPEIETQRSFLSKHEALKAMLHEASFNPDFERNIVALKVASRNRVQSAIFNATFCCVNMLQVFAGKRHRNIKRCFSLIHWHFCLHSIWGYIQNNCQSININCKPPKLAIEPSKPIQCSDRIAFGVGRVLFNVSLGNTPWFDTTHVEK